MMFFVNKNLNRNFTAKFIFVYLYKRVKLCEVLYHSETKIFINEQIYYLKSENNFYILLTT